MGATSLQAGELIRLLINHPEVEIVALQAKDSIGRSAATIHHGLVGEEIVNISEIFSPEEVDILFIADNIEGKDTLINTFEQNWPEERLIDLSDTASTTLESSPLSIGLSEINRKELVRTAKTAKILPPVVVLSLIGLYPVAAHLMLPKEIFLEVAAPEDIIEHLDKIKTESIIKSILSGIQKSFEDSIIEIHSQANTSERVMRIKITFKCEAELEEILKAFDSIYDDHNFVFTSLSEVEGREIEGTHKVVINVKKPSQDQCELEVVGDCRLRGGAGDAVHVMNLFFSLYEKIGLQLKPSRYGQSPESTSRPREWFG